jgi:hypothetical protein
VCAALSRGSFGQRGAAILRPSLPHLCLWLRLTFSPDSPRWRNFVARFIMEIGNLVGTLNIRCRASAAADAGR